MPLSISASVSQSMAGLHLVYAVDGNIAALRIPGAEPPGPSDGLWQHTCLEAFVAADGGAGYREFNFSPSGQWAAYRFASERTRETTSMEAEVPPLTQTRSSAHQLILTAELPWNALPRQASDLCIGLNAVIEEADGRLSYWALNHPLERPDFHHPASRALRLALLPKHTP